MKSTAAWWKETFIYQIYPRSFRDSNGDGIGDLPGITASLDYLKDLGVETIWLSPIFKSPNDDNGYDVADYCDIMDDFGTMDDFDTMLAEMKKRDMRVILDIVANHSSDEHAWFESAKQSRDSPYRDYYIWHEGEPGTPPNNWVSFFGGSAWEYNEATQDYYLHLFTKKQPDLNWENPQLRQEIYKAMRFWLDKGVSGFRFDVLPLISKRPGYPALKEGAVIEPDTLAVYANGPRVHEFVQEMHQEVLQHYDCFTVGEGIGVFPQHARAYVGEDRKELNTVYYFDHMFLDRDPQTGAPIPLDLKAFKSVIQQWDDVMKDGGWNTFYLSNHDQPRPLSRYGDTENYRDESAKMLATLLFTLKALPFIYQGDEFGMENMHFTAPEQFDDVWVANQYRALQEKGGDVEEFLRINNIVSRDHARTPFPWNSQKHGGFTTADKPWLVVNPNFDRINAEAIKAQENSIWHYYKRIMQMRREDPVLIYGDYQDLAPEHSNLMVYVRSHETGKRLIILNFSGEEQVYTLPEEMTIERLLLGNYPDLSQEQAQLVIRPFEARVYQIA